jgi:hypothetical protein
MYCFEVNFGNMAAITDIRMCFNDEEKALQFLLNQDYDEVGYVHAAK